MTTCICGHDISKHSQQGCMAIIDNDADKYCPCELNRMDVIKISAEAAEARAAQAEHERDEARRQLAEAQMAIDVLSNTVVAQNNEIKRLRQKHEDVEQYRAEIERLNQAATA